MTNREMIMGRIREALRHSAPHPGHEAGTGTFAPQPVQTWLPRVGDTFEERMELFRQNAEALKAEFLCCEGAVEATNHLRALAAAGSWRKIASHKGELAAGLVEETGLDLLWTDAGYDTAELEHCDAGVTECDALVAQTGSVLVTASSAGGRALSVLPPHHVVLAKKSQVVPDLSAALDLAHKKYGANFPSFLSFITGPSRTGDIERILVLGAHGPKRLTILLLP